MFRRIFIPTTSSAYRHSQDAYIKMAKGAIEEKQNYLTTLKDILDRAERAKLHNLERNFGDDSRSLISTLCDSIETCNTLRAHRKEVEENIKNYEHLVKCQTTLDWTGYPNFKDWGKKMSDGYESLTSSLITLSLAGAAIVYATIFSAVRGDIGLMIFTFPLFSIGFIIPALIQIGLSWGARSSRSTPFASQTFWRITIAVFMALASLAVGAALTILNVTVFGLRKNSDILTDSVSRVAGITAFAFSGLLVLIFLASATLTAFARGHKLVFRGTANIEARGQEGKQFYEFDHIGTVLSKSSSNNV